MSQLNNAPLVEVIFEIKWGRAQKQDKGLMLHFSQEEISMMPGKFQVVASEAGFGVHVLIPNQPPIPHVIKYRFRKKPNGYPLYQLGDGIFALNQTDVDGFSYDWDIFKKDLENGINLLEKSYPFPLKNLPIVDIQLRFRDVILVDEGSCTFEMISNKLDIGTLKIPDKLKENSHISTDSPIPSLAFQFKCNKPKGKIICQINDGISSGHNALIMDFIVLSDFTEIASTDTDSLIEWSVNAHDRHREIFKSIIKDDLMETFV